MSDILTDQKVDWDLVDILLVLSITFSLTSLTFLILEESIEFLFTINVLQLIKPILLNLIQAILLAGLTLLIVKVKYNLTLKHFGLKIIKFSVNIKYGVLGGLVICILIMILNNISHNLISSLFGIKAPTQRVIQILLDSQNISLFMAHSFLIVIIAPITEEIFFRGFIYPYCKSKAGVIKGIILNGIIFGAAHFSYWVFLPTFFGGIILAWIYERTHSLYSCIIAHGTWNLIIVILIYIIWKINIF